MRRQKLPQGVEGGQLSVAGNSDGFHEEMSTEKMGDHLKEKKTSGKVGCKYQRDSRTTKNSMKKTLLSFIK